jgi:hypothetical protein
LSQNEPIRLRDALGRELRSNRVRRTICRASEAGRVRTKGIVGAVSAHTAGRATRPSTVIPVRVQAGSAFVRGPAPGGCSTVWVAPPSATL